MSEATGLPVVGPAATAQPRPVDHRLGRRVKSRWLVTAAALAGLAFVLMAVAARDVPYYPIDVDITRAVQALSPPATLPLEALNVVGFPPVVTILYAVIVLVIFLAGLRWEAAGAGLATLGAAVLTDFIKTLVQRPRPSPELVNVAHPIESTGFPAGHVLNITAFAGFIAYLVWARMAPSWRRTGLIVLLLSMILLMGPARILAGEHWPSDVLGAYLIAIVWLAAAIGIYQWGKDRKRATHAA